MFSRPKILFLVSLLFVALLNPKFNPYLLFKFLIFYHSYIYIRKSKKGLIHASDFATLISHNFVCDHAITLKVSRTLD